MWAKIRLGFGISICTLAATATLAWSSAAGAANPAPEVPGEPAVAEPFARETPRSSVRAFQEATNAGDWKHAAEYLHLAPVARARRAEVGPVLARHLKTVLERTLWLEPDLLSDVPEGNLEDGLPRQRDRIGTIETAGGRVEIFVDRVRRPDGPPIWQFSAATVAQIPALYEEFGYGPLGELLPPIFFESHVLAVQLWQWFGLLLIVLVAYFGSWIAVSAIMAAIRPFAARSATDLDDRLLAALAGPLRVAFATVLFALLLPALGFALPAQRFFTGLVKALAVASVTWFLLRVIDLFGQLVETRLEARGQAGATAFVPLGRKAVKVIVATLAALAALDSFGFDVTALVAGLGIGGLAVALALQKTLENLFGGATVIADRPVQVGDFCRFGDKLGTVEEIGLRSTRVRTLDRTLVTVPNADFSTMQLESFTKRDKIWYHPCIGLRYETTPEQLRYVLVEVRRMLYAHPKVDSDPARVRFTNFGAFSLDIDIFAYIRVTDYSEFLEVSEDLNLRIMDIVEASGSGFAFPSSTTYLAKDDGLDAEKVRQAEETVRGWRERKELCLPGFPPEKIAELQATLDYPPQGSVLRGDAGVR